MRKATHVMIGDIVMDARAKAFNAVTKAVAEADPDATVDVTQTLFREAWQEATPPADDLKQSALRLPSDDVLARVEAMRERMDAMNCTLSQIRGIVEIAIDTIEEHGDCTIGTRMCDATAALYGAVALAKAHDYTKT